MIITSPTGFDIALTNVEAMLKKCWYNVVSKLCNVENLMSDFVSFSTSDKRWSTTLKQRWSDVEMLAGVYKETERERERERERLSFKYSLLCVKWLYHEALFQCLLRIFLQLPVALILYGLNIWHKSRSLSIVMSKELWQLLIRHVFGMFEFVSSSSYILCRGQFMFQEDVTLITLRLMYYLVFNSKNSVPFSKCSYKREFWKYAAYTYAEVWFQ